MHSHGPHQDRDHHNSSLFDTPRLYESLESVADDLEPEEDPQTDRDTDSDNDEEEDTPPFKSGNIDWKGATL